MSTKTHIITTLCISIIMSCLLELTPTEGLTVALFLLVGNALPDIDNPYKGIGRKFPTIARTFYIGTHAIGFTKSLIFLWLLILISCILPVRMYEYLLLIIIGYVLHLIQETLFKHPPNRMSNVRWLYPYHVRIEIPLYRTEKQCRIIHYVATVCVIGFAVYTHINQIELAPSAANMVTSMLHK